MLTGDRWRRCGDRRASTIGELVQSQRTRSFGDQDAPSRVSDTVVDHRPVYRSRRVNRRIGRSPEPSREYPSRDDPLEAGVDHPDSRRRPYSPSVELAPSGGRDGRFERVIGRRERCNTNGWGSVTPSARTNSSDPSGRKLRHRFDRYRRMESVVIRRMESVAIGRWVRWFADGGSGCYWTMDSMSVNDRSSRYRMVGPPTIGQQF